MNIKDLIKQINNQSNSRPKQNVMDNNINNKNKSN